MPPWLTLLMLATPLFADLRIVTKQMFGTTSQTITDYFKGDLLRRDIDSRSFILDKNHTTVIDHRKHDTTNSRCIRRC